PISSFYGKQVPLGNGVKCVSISSAFYNIHQISGHITLGLQEDQYHIMFLQSSSSTILCITYHHVALLKPQISLITLYKARNLSLTLSLYLGFGILTGNKIPFGDVLFLCLLVFILGDPLPNILFKHPNKDGIIWKTDWIIMGQHEKEHSQFFFHSNTPCIMLIDIVYAKFIYYCIIKLLGALVYQLLGGGADKNTGGKKW
ncbi:hypothetical protein ACJX0J_031353, partial [Zea mays]